MPPPSASGADGDGGNAERERDVGVGGAEAGFGAEVEVTVDGAEGGEERGVVGEGCRRDGRRWFRSGVEVGSGWDVGWRFARGGLGDGAVEEGATSSCGGELVGVGGAEVEQRGGGGGDGVDGGAAGDVTDVEGGAGIVGESEVARWQGAGEDEDGVGRAGVGPGVAAGAGDGDAEAAAAEGAGDDGVGASAFERDGGGDAAA